MDYGKLTDEDKVYIGNPYPALQLGLNMNFEYKGFDLAANFFGTFGNKIFNLQKARYSGAGGQNVFKGTLNKAWHGEGTSDDIPRLSYNDLNQNYTRVLFTITKYSGMDPERPFYDGGAITTGIDYSNYPTPRTYVIGLDFKF